MRLALLADHEGVEPPTSGGGGVHHGRGDRVGPQGETADRLELPVGNQGAHHATDDRRHRPIERDPPHVNVIVGSTTGSQYDPPADDRQCLDLRNQLGGVLSNSRRTHDAHTIYLALARARSPECGSLGAPGEADENAAAAIWDSFAASFCTRRKVTSDARERAGDDLQLANGLGVIVYFVDRYS